MAAESVKKLSLRIESALDGKQTYNELRSLLADIGKKLGDISQTSSNFRVLSKGYEGINKLVKEQKVAIDEVTKADEKKAKAAKESEQAQKKAQDVIKQKLKETGEALVKVANEEAKAAANANLLKQVLSGNVGQMSMQQLRSGLKLVNDEMNRLVLDGRKGTQEYNQFKNAAGILSKQIHSLGREFKGLSPEVRSSSRQILELFENIGVIATVLEQKLSRVFSFIGDSIKKGLDRQSVSEYFKGTVEDLENLKKASAGGINETVLKSLSIQASDLNVGMREQIILMSLAEKVADKNLQTTEEGFKDVIAVSEGRTKVVKDLGIETGKYKQRVEELTAAYKDENGEIDPTIEKQMRLQALVELSGETFEGATNKVQDNKDKYEELGVVWDNLKAKMGEGFIDTITDKFDDLGIAMENFGIKSDATAGFTEKLTDKFTGHLDILARMVLPWTNLVDVVKSASESFAEIRQNVNDSDTALGSITSTLGSTVPTTLIDLIWDAAENAKQSLREFLYLIGMLSSQGANQDDGIGGVVGDATGDRGRLFKSTVKKKSGKSGNQGLSNEDKENLTFEQKITKDIAELREKMANEPLKKIRDGYQKEVDILQFQLDYAKGLYDNLIDISKLKPIKLIEQNVTGRTSGPDGSSGLIDIAFSELAQLNVVIPVIDAATASLQQFFSAFAQGDPNAFKQFMKTVVTSFITGVQAIILGGDAAMLTQAILNPFTLIKNAPLKAASILALEAAKGLLQGLNQGGNVGPGSYLVGDGSGGSITPYTEILHVPAGSKASVYPNRQLTSMINANVKMSGSAANVTNYIRVDMDKGNAYIEGKSQASKYANSFMIKG